MSSSSVYSVYYSFDSGSDIEGTGSILVERKNSSCLFRAVTFVERTPNVQRTYMVK